MLNVRTAATIAEFNREASAARPAWSLKRKVVVTVASLVALGLSIWAMTLLVTAAQAESARAKAAAHQIARETCGTDYKLDNAAKGYYWLTCPGQDTDRIRP